MMRRSHIRNRFGEAPPSTMVFKAGSSAIRVGEKACTLCIRGSRHNNGQLFIASVDRAEQCHAATTIIEIHQSGIELTPVLTNNLQSIADVSCDKHDCARPKSASRTD
jgi:hypothetical protein